MAFFKKARPFDPKINESINASLCEPFRISRSKIDLFVECPRCFYLDARLGVKRPSLPGFTLNIAVDHLLKKEFDIHRANKTPHPIMEENGIDAIPFAHEDMETWRHNFTGVQHLHEPTNLFVFGAVDDIWVTPKGELMVVDYKATSKQSEINLEGRFGEQYQRQMEVYQWLLRQNGFKVSDTGYFVYVNGRKDPDTFDKKLEFEELLIPHTGTGEWIEPTLQKIYDTLMKDDIPEVGENCDHCPYRDAAGNAFKKHLTGGKKETKKKSG
jgi:CRISPR/Cas system-associated exonuclease Cas4 (RecB family)